MSYLEHATWFLVVVGVIAASIRPARFEYGGLAMQSAGRMAEKASGIGWEALFQEKIALPLGIKSTHFTPVDLGGGHSPMLGGGPGNSDR